MVETKVELFNIKPPKFWRFFVFLHSARRSEGKVALVCWNAVASRRPHIAERLTLNNHRWATVASGRDFEIEIF